MRRGRTRAIGGLALAACVATAGCREVKGWLGLDEAPAPAPEAEPEAPVEAALDLGVTPRPPEPLRRADRKLEFPAKDAWHLGFNLRELSKTYALAAAVEVPTWSAEGEGDPLDTRDDDIDSGWRCEATDDAPCALGLTFPEPATVTAVRLWALAPAAEDHARVETVQVHTDAGWVKVRFADDPTAFVHVIFGRPVTTSQLTVEITGVHPGRKTSQLWIGELEAFGEAGAERPGMSIDPRTLVVTHPQPAWHKSGLERKLAPSFLARVRPDGTIARIGPGSAVYGQSGDRILLVEQLLQTVCKVHKGRYFAVDQKTRVWVPVGDLGGMVGDVYRHEAGLGWTVGYADEESPRMEAIVVDGDTYNRHKTQRMSRTTTPEYFEQWHTPPDVVPRGGVGLRDAQGPCRPATKATIAPLGAELGKAADPAAWSVCPLGHGHQAFVADGGGCGKRWDVKVVADSGRVVASRGGKASGGARVEVRSSEELGLLVEVGASADDSQVFLVRSDGITDLPPGTGFAVRPPAGCRERCDSPFANARKPE